MGQLTMVALREQIELLTARVFALEELSGSESIDETSGDAPDLYTRIATLEEQVDNPIQWVEGTGPIPQWGLDMVEALIEALKGVRLQGAQQYALELEAKYFSGEGESSSEPEVERTVNENVKLYG